jgi:hypothetical protein
MKELKDLLFKRYRGANKSYLQYHYSFLTSLHADLQDWENANYCLGQMDMIKNIFYDIGGTYEEFEELQNEVK